MGELLLLEDIFDEVTAAKRKTFTLFAKPSWMKFGSTTYDVVFYYLPIISPEQVSNGRYQHIPVLSYEYPKEAVHAKLRMQELYKSNSQLSTFAVRDISPKMLETKEGKKPLPGTTLEFFDVRKVPLGLEIEKQDAYSVISQSELQSIFKERWAAIVEFMSGCKAEINRDYSC